MQAAASDFAAVQSVEEADAVLEGGDLCPPCSMGLRLAASMALARAGRVTQASARLDEARCIAAAAS